MSHNALGEFEQMVLLAIVRLRGDVYGVPITEEIERRTGRPVSPAAVWRPPSSLSPCSSASTARASFDSGRYSRPSPT